MSNYNTPTRILPIIVFSQFCCTSLWFAGNAVMPDLLESFDLAPTALGSLTSAVQFGFILGTLIFAILSIADRFSPSKVFFFCALIGAVANLGAVWEGNTLWSLLSSRFATGFFLAGIYPVGMKIAADYYEKGLGKSLGFLVGALVLGTAFPHLLKQFTQNIQWQLVIYITSVLASLGGVLLLVLVPDGPFGSRSQKPDFSAFFQVFNKKEFRASALGYFGHMWELYAFWAFIPVILIAYKELHFNIDFNIPLLSFSIIGIGSLSCIAGGYISEKYGAKKTAGTFLLLSGLCCLISPMIILYAPAEVFIFFLLFWGMVVIADSPLFSTLVAKNAPSAIKGTALTIVNSVGFAITIISIQLLNILWLELNPVFIYIILAIGPFFGLLGLFTVNRLSVSGRNEIEARNSKF
ncbi:Nitrate/nitrite transporter NarK [Marivirga sericea]|uniref:Nitrate/nitrite transporter NarK n=1 Tax=Marivirga sericea TaxID=1028 RepID=A0A1X7LEJ1_9BACT|nr:MFS transporter [Marivirga sericea]SMG52110.1 Nitrate/nitrite transporter NarK [Marivirga sericea]